MRKIYIFFVLFFCHFSHVSLYAQGSVDGITDFDNPLITEVDQFSSPYSDEGEGNFYSLLGLIDECPEDQHPNNDFWQSDWHHGNQTPGTHYFQVELADPESVPVLVVFWFKRRPTANDHTTEWNVLGTNDPDAAKEDCEVLTYVATPYHNNTEEVTSTPFTTSGYKYLRFYSEAQEGDNAQNFNRGYFHLARFNIYPHQRSELSSDLSFKLHGTEATVIGISDDNVEDIVIPQAVTFFEKDFTVTSIGAGAFEGCRNLISISIPNSVITIGDNAFSGCSGLTSISIPNSVTSIGESAFSSCRGLTSVTIPNSVTNIGFSAFSDCSGLTSITIPDKVTSIGDNFLSGCSGLSSVIIPNSVTAIGNQAFSGCSGLSSITISNSVNTIADGAFLGCSGLSEIIIREGNERYDSRNACNAIIETVTNTLIMGCQGTIIPSSVTTIGESAFSSCDGLRSITLPEGVTMIKPYAFNACSYLSSVTLPSTITTIKLNAFFGCKLIQDVYCYATKVNSTNGSAFDASISNATLHVPASALTYYKSTAPWSRFGSIVAIEGGEEPEAEKCATPTISYVGGKLTFGCSTEGVEFVYELKSIDGLTGKSAEVNFTGSFLVKVYATKEGYENSDTATKEIQLSSAGGVPGDMTGDGTVSVSDVTKVIDIILGKEQQQE